MLVLFDQGAPVPIRQFLIGHTVKTAAEQGWRSVFPQHANGYVTRQARLGFGL